MDLQGVPPFELLPYSSVGSRWDRWLRYFANYLLAENVTEDAQKKALLLHCAGTDVFDLGYALGVEVASSYAQTVEKLTSYFNPKRSLVRETTSLQPKATLQPATAQLVHALPNHHRFIETTGHSGRRQAAGREGAGVSVTSSTPRSASNPGRASPPYQGCGGKQHNRSAHDFMWTSRHSVTSTTSEAMTAIAATTTGEAGASEATAKEVTASIAATANSATAVQPAHLVSPARSLPLAMATPPETFAPSETAVPPEKTMPLESAVPPEIAAPPETVTPDEISTATETPAPLVNAVPPEIAAPPEAVTLDEITVATESPALSWTALPPENFPRPDIAAPHEKAALQAESVSREGAAQLASQAETAVSAEMEIPAETRATVAASVIEAPAVTGQPPVDSYNDEGCKSGWRVPAVSRNACINVLGAVVGQQRGTHWNCWPGFLLLWAPSLQGRNAVKVVTKKRQRTPRRRRKRWRQPSCLLTAQHLK